VPIHGRRTQSQRDQALRQFATGRAPALVATDVAARGIHVDGVACVVHFDLPDEPKDHLHRSGRTGRAGASGTVVTLVPEDGHRAARLIQRKLDRPEPIEAPDLGRLDVPAMQP
jgi:superfamily II DNA/RNA helicase